MASTPAGTGAEMRHVSVDPEETEVYLGDRLVATVLPLDPRAGGGVNVRMRLPDIPSRYLPDRAEAARFILAAVDDPASIPDTAVALPF